MAMERRDPVPPGRYWVFILEHEIAGWQTWVSANKATVSVIATERKDRLAPFRPAIMVTRPDLSIIMEEGGAWILFDVTAPTPWVGYGFPTIVTDPTIVQSSQIEQAPPPAPDDELARQLYGKLKEIVLWGGALYFGGVVALRVVDNLMLTKPKAKASS